MGKKFIIPKGPSDIEKRGGRVFEHLHIPKCTDVKVQSMYKLSRDGKPLFMANYHYQLDLAVFANVLADGRPHFPIDVEFDDPHHWKTMGVKKDECLLPEQYIWSYPVPKMIKDVNIGDNVFDMYGEIAMVKDKRIVNYDGEVVDFTLGRAPFFTASVNHRLFVARLRGYENGRISTHIKGGRSGEKYWLGNMVLKERDFVYSWLPADQIMEGDYLVLPKHNLEFGTIHVFHSRESGSYRKMPMEVVIDEEVAWLLGIYTAEGSYSENYIQVCFSFNLKDEMPLAEKISEVITRRFNLTGKKSIREEDSSLCIITTSSLFGEFLVEMCGKRAHGKHIPEYIFTSPSSIKIAYLKGLFKGDGNVTKEDGIPVGFKFTTVSKQLINEVAFLMASLNIPCKFTVVPPKQHFIGENLVKSSESYTIELKGKPSRLFGYDCPDRKRYSWVIEKGNWLHVPVRKIIKRRYVGELIDIETSTENFLMPFVSHNSRDVHLLLTNFWFCKNPYYLRHYKGTTGWVVLRIPYAKIENVVRKDLSLNLESRAIKSPKLSPEDNINGAAYQFKLHKYELRQGKYRKKHEAMLKQLSDVIELGLNATTPQRILMEKDNIIVQKREDFREEDYRNSLNPEEDEREE